jgi:hypothetical protein
MDKPLTFARKFQVVQYSSIAMVSCARAVQRKAHVFLPIGTQEVA